MPFNKYGKRKKHPYKRNPYTNSPIGDLSGDKVYGPATAIIAAGKKFIKGSKDFVKGAAQAGKTLRKAVKKSKNITRLTLSFTKFKTYITLAICGLTAIKQMNLNYFILPLILFSKLRQSKNN